MFKYSDSIGERGSSILVVLQCGKIIQFVVFMFEELPVPICYGVSWETNRGLNKTHCSFH